MLAKVPKIVISSVGLLFAAHAVGLWQMILLSRTLGVPVWMPYSTLAVVYAALAALLVMLLLGKNWARITYTIVTVLGLFSLVGSDANPSVIEWVILAAKVVAVGLLYIGASDSWFSRGGADHRTESNSSRG